MKQQTRDYLFMLLLVLFPCGLYLGLQAKQIIRIFVIWFYYLNQLGKTFKVSESIFFSEKKSGHEFKCSQHTGMKCKFFSLG